MLNLENETGTLQKLLQTVLEQKNRKEDFVTSTVNLQKTTDADGNAKIVIEEGAGNQPAF